MGTFVSSCISLKTGNIEKDAACYANFNSCTNPELYNILIEKEKRFYPLEEIYEYFEYLKRAGLKIGNYFEDEDGSIQVNITSDKKMERLIASSVIRYLWENKYVNERAKSQDQYFKIHEHFMNLCRYFPEKDFFRLLLFATNLFATGNRYVDTNHAIIGSTRGTKIMSYEKLVKSSGINTALYSDKSDGYFEDMKIRDEYKTKEDYQKAFDIYNNKLMSLIATEQL